MAYSAPTTITTGQLVTASLMNTDWGGNITFLANPPACSVYHNATQSVTHGVGLTPAFNSESYDTNGMHDNVTNNALITIQTAGLYLITANIELAAATDYTLSRLGILLNNTTFIAMQNVGTVADNNTGLALSVAKPWKCAVNDNLRLQVIQRNGAAAARNIGAGPGFGSGFTATWIGLG